MKHKPKVHVRLVVQIWEDSLATVHAVEPSEAMRHLGVQIQQRRQSEAATDAAGAAEESEAAETAEAGSCMEAGEAEEGNLGGFSNLPQKAQHSRTTARAGGYKAGGGGGGVSGGGGVR